MRLVKASVSAKDGTSILKINEIEVTGWHLSAFLDGKKFSLPTNFLPHFLSDEHEAAELMLPLLSHLYTDYGSYVERFLGSHGTQDSLTELEKLVREAPNGSLKALQGGKDTLVLTNGKDGVAIRCPDIRVTALPPNAYVKEGDWLTHIDSLDGILEEKEHLFSVGVSLGKINAYTNLGEKAVIDALLSRPQSAPLLESLSLVSDHMAQSTRYRLLNAIAVSNDANQEKIESLIKIHVHSTAKRIALDRALKEFVAEGRERAIAIDGGLLASCNDGRWLTISAADGTVRSLPYSTKRVFGLYRKGKLSASDGDIGNVDERCVREHVAPKIAKVRPELVLLL